MEAQTCDNNSHNVIPDGYVAVAIDPVQHESPLRLCVLFRPEPDEAGGHFVVLRDMLIGQALLGCIVDAGGVIHDWIEVWIQGVEGLAGSPAAVRERRSNAAIDADWSESFEASQQFNTGHVVRTGWEISHPPPTFVHRTRHVPVQPSDKASGHALELCTDECLLATKDLPAYSTSLHRYLYCPELGEKSPFVPATADAPRNESTRELKKVVENSTDLLPLNPGAGLLQARKYSPIRFEPYADVIAGATWNGVFHGTTHLGLSDTLRGLSQASTLRRMADGYLVVSRKGQCDRLTEVFHLKLRLIADAVAAVRSHVLQTQRPLLNLTADSFQVRLGECAVGLPFLWSAQVVLVNPGEAIPLPIEGSELTYYLPGRGERTSIYRLASGQLPAKGEGMLRIRQVIDEAGGAVVTEGTLDTHERLNLARHDLIWLRIRSAGGAINIYANVDPDKAMAAGEVRFRSVAQCFTEKLRGELKALEGVPVDRVPFEVVPLMSSPGDLYALGVLAVRTLFTNPDMSLPVALDEVLSLARQTALDHQESTSLPERIMGTIANDKRWVESLGPHRLIRDTISPEDAFSYVPPELWRESLAMVLRTLPGIGPDSICHDLGDASPSGLHTVFDPLVEDLEALLVRSRSLIVVDWAANREIHSVIRRHFVGLAGIQGVAS